MRAAYPHYTPKDDFELYVLCGWRGPGIIEKETAEERQTFLEATRPILAELASYRGCSLMEYVREQLDQWYEPTGVSASDTSTFSRTQD